MTHEREATLVGQVKEPERRVNRTGHLVHFERTPGPCDDPSSDYTSAGRAGLAVLACLPRCNRPYRHFGPYSEDALSQYAATYSYIIVSTDNQSPALRISGLIDFC
jgi:hypothetical protein